MIRPNVRTAAVSSNDAPAKRIAREKYSEMFFHFRGRACYAAAKEMDNIIEAKEVQIERKHFHVEFRENDRGKFLRITEEAHGRRNTIIVPSTGVGEFTAAIGEVVAGVERT